MKKIVFISLVLLFSFLSVSALLVRSASLYITKSTGRTPQYFWQLYQGSRSQPTLTTRFNTIVLGLDYRDDIFEKTQTTDTIILTSFNNARVTLLSLPRDLWDYSLSSKINSIYPLSLDQPDSFDYIQDNFSRLTGQPLDRTLVLTTDNLRDLISLTGPVTVYLDQGFKDDRYPNPDYIKNPNPKTPVYTTVEFPSGWITLDSSNITGFVRSRKSPEGGTDLGRIHRQQLAIDGLLSKVSSTSFLANPNNLTRLYRFWHDKISTNITDQDLASILYSNLTNLNRLKLVKTEIPIGTTPDNGVIYHPPVFISPAWVFIPSDKDYHQLQSFISTSLK